jgi:hypothetical protein
MPNLSRKPKKGGGSIPPEARAELLSSIRMGLELQHAAHKHGVDEAAVRADKDLMLEISAAYRQASARFRTRLLELALKQTDGKMLAELAQQREAAALVMDPRAPRSLTMPSCKQLASLRGVRRQLVNIYREAKAGLLDAGLFGRLVNCLNVVQTIDNGRLLEERLDEIERKLMAATQAAAAKPAGDGAWPPRHYLDDPEQPKC